MDSRQPVPGPPCAEQAIGYLLSRNFLLTALELLHEAGEAGLHHEVERLAEFFKDPALFPPDAVAACNPENGAMFSQVAAERQQQLSQLQYELAVYREDLAALADAQHGQQPGDGGTARRDPPPPRVLPGVTAGAAASLGPTQLATLHHAVLAHLQAQGFKLSALSLSKEAYLPAGTACTAEGSLERLFLAAEAADADAARRRELEEQVRQQSQQVAQLAEELEESRRKEAAASAEAEFLRGKLAFLGRQTAERQHAQQEQSEQAPGMQAGAGCEVDSAAAQLQAGLDLDSSHGLNCAPEFSSMGTSSALAEVAACMPKILPNLLINSRDELVPVLLALCQEHPSAPGRQQMAGLLFNLIKKPNAAQVSHELVERRLLVADAAGAQGQLLPPAQAAPAVLQLLEGLLRDAQPQVRCHALAALAQLVAALGQDSSAAGDVLRLALAAAGDADAEATRALLQTVLPALLSWLEQSELLVSQLVPQILAELHSVLDACQPAAAVDDSVLLRALPAGAQTHATTLLKMFIPTLPALRSCGADYVAASAVPALIRAALLAGWQEASQLTQHFVFALKAVCLTFGESFAAAAVCAQLLAAAGLGRYIQACYTLHDEESCSDALHARMAAAGLLSGPTTPGQRIAGLSCALPLLLSGALPYAGPTAVAECLRRLCTDGGSGGGSWALEHPRALVLAVRSAAQLQLVQAQLLPLLWELATSKQPGPRLAAALLAGASAPALPKQQVSRQLLPLLSTLGGDEDDTVCRAAIAAASVIFGSFAAEQDVQEDLLASLDNLLISGKHDTELAMLEAFGPAASQASPQQLEWLLQRILLMLAGMHARGEHGKTPSQLAEAAAAAFVALRQIEAVEMADSRLHLHFVAALTALQREADLLEPPQRDTLAAVIEDHEEPGQGGAANSMLSVPVQFTARTNALLPHSAAPNHINGNVMGTGSVTSRGERRQLSALFAGSRLLAFDADKPISIYL